MSVTKVILPKLGLTMDEGRVIAWHKKEGDRIDSVNVTVPDHMHFSIAYSAIQKGKHVYCQKPLCHDVAEVSLSVAGGAEARTKDIPYPSLHNQIEHVARDSLLRRKCVEDSDEDCPEQESVAFRNVSHARQADHGEQDEGDGVHQGPDD